MKEENKEKLLDLLADESLFGLSEAEAAELERLKGEFPEFKDDFSFELSAAAISLTNLEPSDRESPLPARLQAKILADADRFFAAAGGGGQNAPAAAAAAAAEPETKAPAVEAGGGWRNGDDRAPKIPWWNWLGWGVAAAACLALAVNLWLTRGGEPRVVVQDPRNIQTPTPAPPLTPAEERERFVASARDLVRTGWTEPDPKTAKQITGDIVWSDAEQRGFLRFRNLPANDPSRETYQLWIFDENQPEATPVDGGVFDAAADGEIVVPIDAKIKVRKPKMFAVTVEKPGGVVVSDRKRLVTIAKV